MPTHTTGLLPAMAGGALVGQCRGRSAACNSLLQAAIKAKGTNKANGTKRTQLGKREVEKLVWLFARHTLEMPKLKTRRAAAKRFRITGSGKFMRRHAFHNHLLDHKSPKRKRFLGTMAVVDETDHDRVSLMLPYAS